MNRTETAMTIQKAKEILSKITSYLRNAAKEKSRQTSKFLKGLRKDIETQINSLEQRLNKGRIERTDSKCKVFIDSTNYYKLDTLGVLK